ncbi:MAG: type III pantothenate kinase [Zoogloeaceae bacterium]|jgi:type III pantothenate kinase|nr:type III pantothenate kinase [Zoogloeaceae bacterium]
MLLCLDAGNSRLKWGLSRNRAADWQSRGALPWADIDHLPRRLAAVCGESPPRAALLASVVDDKREAALRRAPREVYPQLALAVVQSGAAAAGVINGYGEPEALGADRWCALIGARHLESRPCLVVMAGTATTIDSLDAAGRFLGGLILPGLGMMRAALARGAAKLSPERVSGAHLPFPRNTADAVTSGCLEAQIGAVERAFARLPGAACCLLSGGASPALLPLLAALPARHVPDLTLEGLRRMDALAPR